MIASRKQSRSQFRPHPEEAQSAVSKDEGGPILRDASLRDAPQDEANRERASKVNAVRRVADVVAALVATSLLAFDEGALADDRHMISEARSACARLATEHLAKQQKAIAAPLAETPNVLLRTEPVSLATFRLRSIPSPAFTIPVPLAR